MKHRARKIFEFHLARWAKVISTKRTTVEMGLLHFRTQLHASVRSDWLIFMKKKLMVHRDGSD